MVVIVGVNWFDGRWSAAFTVGGRWSVAVMNSGTEEAKESEQRQPAKKLWETIVYKNRTTGDMNEMNIYQH